MWFLKADSDGRCFYVRADKTDLYVGRGLETCDLVLTDDASISRRHALLRQEDNCLTLQDLRSTHKTYLNDKIATKTPLNPNTMIKLNPFDKIRFGIMHNVWTVHTVLFITCTSTIKGENLNDIKTDLDSVGGTLVSDWDESVTHLTMPAIQMTIKVLQALAYRRPIVTPDFWRACRDAVHNKQCLPDPGKFSPPVIEAALNAENISFAPDESRKTVFAGKKFIFFSRKQMNTYGSVLVKCSASVALLSESRMTKAKLCADDVVVIQFTPGMTSQESQSQQQAISDITTYLNSKSRRVVPDLEISLALLYNSTVKYCNSKLNIPMQILNACNTRPEIPKPTSNILAPETQDVVENNTNKPLIIIDQSLASLRNEDAVDDQIVSHVPSCSRETVERPKRKLSNNSEDLNKQASKRSALNISLQDTEDGSMFDFVESSKAHGDNTTKPVEKKLGFMKVRNRKNNNENLDDNIFEFIPDKKDVKTDGPVSCDRNKLFQSNDNKRKNESKDMPQAKRPSLNFHVAPSISMGEVKADISELLKNSFWKSCNDEMAKQEIIKEEQLDESEEKKVDMGITVITMRTDLIKRDISSLVNGSSNSFADNNFKKFKKVMPLHMQVTVMPSSVMKIYRSETCADVDVHSSDEEADIWKSNKKGKRGCTS